MTEEVFRIVVAAAVGLACVATLVQAVVALVAYRAIRGIERKIAPLTARVQPVIDRINPVLDSIEATFEKAGPVIQKIGVVAEKTGPVIERFGPIADRVGPVVEKIGPAVVQAGLVLQNANQLLTETRPKIARISDDVAGIAKSGREQVDRAGEFLRDAGGRALNRLEQIDRTVESTVSQVEQAGDVVKRAVMTPVREVNGIAAGISAAVSTLVHHPRRPHIDEATQDEEMFI
jgi:ABC-type transporter Mla subunit MlaD